MLGRETASESHTEVFVEGGRVNVSVCEYVVGWLVGWRREAWRVGGFL